MSDGREGLFSKKITRRNAIKTIGGAALIGMMGGFRLNEAFAAGKRPNIIFILTDDHRWDALSCMGHPFIKTPNLDRIAEEGILFENAAGVNVN